MNYKCTIRRRRKPLLHSDKDVEDAKLLVLMFLISFVILIAVGMSGIMG